MPDVPSPEECREVQGEGWLTALSDVIEFVFVPGYEGWRREKYSAEPRLRMWMRFADDRPIDTISLPGISDMGPPVAFAQGRFGWSPTLQLHVGTFAKPTGSWVLLDAYGSPYGGSR